MKKIILFLILFLSFSFINAQNDYCHKYADKAVEQYRLAKKNNLPNINWPVWSDDWKGHYNYCKTVSPKVVDKATADRQVYLDKYINNNNTVQVINPTSILLNNTVKTQPKFKMIPGNVVKLNPDIKDLNLMPLASIKYTIGHNLSKGSMVYRDRNFLYWKIPQYLQGLDYLITRNNDKFTYGNHFFTIPHPNMSTVVYIAVDPKVNTPGWLTAQGYSNTWEKLTIWSPDNNSFTEFDIYKKIFDKGGDLVFGGNQTKQNQKQGNMYLVFVNTKNLQPKIKIRINDGSNTSGIAKIKVIKGKSNNEVDDVLIKENDKSNNTKENRICSTQTRKLSAKSSSFMLYDNRDEALFPGNILSISEIESGNFKRAKTPERKPYNISTDIFGLNNTSTAVVKKNTLGDYLNARTKLLNKNNFEGSGPKASFGEFKSIKSSADFLIKTSGSFDYLAYSGKVSAKYKSAVKKNQYYTEIDKVYYNIDANINNGFFRDSNIPNNSDWVYTSRVTYGTKLIVQIKSNYNLKEVSAAMNAKYNAVIIKAQGSISMKYRKILDDLVINVIALGEHSAKDLNNLLSDPSGKTFAAAFSNNKITSSTQLYPLAYTLRYVDDNSIASIQTYAEYKQRKCRKIHEIMRFEFVDILVVEDNDGGSGEDLYGKMIISPWGYGKKVIFNQHFPEDVEGGDPPIMLKDNHHIYYFKYSFKGLNDPKKYLEINTHLREEDSGTDDDFGWPIYRLTLKDIFSGAIYDESYGKLFVPPSWKDKLANSIYQCNDCQVIPFFDDDSKVLVRFKIDLVDKIPQGSKIGFY